MANNNHPDYLESLFQGIDIILEKRLDQVSFDTTIICTITDASNSKNGEYKVTDGTVTYKAYSDLDSYVAGQQVRVSVPMGDYTQKKFIVGKYVSDNDASPITYVSPLETVVNMSGNLVPLNTIASIKANGTERSVVIWNQRMEQSKYADLQANGIYNTIILKADFKTLLSNYDLVSGTYGLRLDLLVRPSVNSTGRIRRYVELSSKEMFGNPYAFSIFSTQAKTFGITTVGLVEGIELSLYQCGDFKDRKSGPITANALTDDIIVNNIELGFGSDIVGVDDNIVKIYSENDLHYKYHNPTDDTNLKKIGLLWYNKDEHNQYVGFSDGIYDPDYDELTYLDASRSDTRLLAQKGRTGIPTDKQSLTLAANIEEAVPLIQKARDVANQDLYRVLTEFNNKVNKIQPIADELKKLIFSVKGYEALYIVNCTKRITDHLALMKEQYEGVLDYGWDRQTQAPADRQSSWEASWNVAHYKNLNQAFQDIRNNVKNALTIIEVLVTTPGLEGQNKYDYTGYKGVFDIYNIRIKRILTTMDEYLGMAVSIDDKPVHNKAFPVSVINGEDFAKFANYENKTDFKTYKEQDLSIYDNRYCIYWYRYEKDYISTDVEKLMPDGWRRLTSDELKSDADVDGINVGLSTKDEENVVDGKVHHAQVPEAGKGFFTFSMQPNLENEKFVALVFYNHNMYKSNELVFTNSDVIPDKTTLDKGDILIFEHGERSSDNFSLYSDLGVLMDAADEQYSRQIKVHYDGLLAKDEAMVGAGIYWYIPNNGDATMLAFDKNYLINRGFTTDLDLEDDEKPDFSREGYVCFYKQIQARKMCSGCNNPLSNCSCVEKTAEPYWDFTNGTDFDNRDFWYKIKRIYNENATQNNLLCEIRLAEDKDPVSGEQVFTFGTAGTNGTKYTLDMVYTSTMVATTKNSNLLLDVFLKDNNGERLPLYRKPEFGSTPGEAYGCNAKWKFHLDNNVAASVDLSLCTTTEGENELVTGLEVGQGHCGIVELSADFAMSTGRVDGDSGDAEKKREVQLNSLQAIPFAAGYYYLSGPTQIIYNNYGTLDNMSMFDSPYRLFFERDQLDANGKIITKAHEQVPNVQWRIKYYLKNDDDIFEELKDSAITAEQGTAEYAEQMRKHNQYILYHQYMPVINHNNGLTPSTLYLANLDCYAVVEAVQSGSVLWEQPIIIVQNRYASAMLNSWDGRFEINEENGTVMATMLGAGRKSKNNTFEGVLMGNIALGTESDIGFENYSNTGFLDQSNLGYSNQTGLGLYGFHDGAQSFGFSIDGSAFLGKAGKGRIIFNGNYGVIASTNWFTGDNTVVDTDGNPVGGGVVGYQVDDEGKTKEGILRTSTAGMCIDLVNGHIDAYDFKLTGSRIHFNSHPEQYTNNPEYPNLTGYLMRIGHDGKTRVDPGENWLTDGQLAQRATPGYITLDAAGNLTMRVNSLYITGSLGGTNLLQQTSPRQTIPQTTTKEGDENHPLYVYNEDGTIKCDWDTTKWLVNTTTVNGATIGRTIVAGDKVIPPNADTNSATDYVLSICDNTAISGVEQYTYQIIKKPTKKGKYTLSGWIRRKVDPGVENNDKLQLTINNCSKSGEIEERYQLEDGSWSIDIADNSSNNFNIGRVFFEDANWIYFEYTISTKSTQSYLRVEFTSTCDFYMWHAQFEEGSVATSWAPSPEDGEASVINNQGIYDKYLNQDKIFNKLIKDPVTGKNMVGIWLLDVNDAYGKRKELYINATYIATGILRSSNWNGTFTTKQVKKTQLVQDNDGTISEVEVKDANGNPVYITTYAIKDKPTTGTYWNLNEGKMWAAKFELSAWDGTQGIYLNSHPNDDDAQYKYYMQIGKSDSYIKFDASYNLDIRSTTFQLTSGKWGSNNFLGLYSAFGDGYKTISGVTSDSWRIVIGNAFGVTCEGKLAASAGKIGGWYIDNNSIYYGTGTSKTSVLKGSDGSIELGVGAGDDATTHFKVDNTGFLEAKGAKLKTLQVIDSLIVDAEGVDGTSSAVSLFRVNGNVTIAGGYYIYLSDLGVKGTRINAAGGKQLVLDAVTGLWLRSAGQDYSDSSLTGYFGIFLQSQTSAIGLDAKTELKMRANKIIMGKTMDGTDGDVEIAGNLNIKADTVVDGNFSFWKAIKCKHPETNAEYLGHTGTVTLSSWTSKHKLSFINGIFIDADGTSGDLEVDVSYRDVGNSTTPVYFDKNGNALACSVTDNTTATTLSSTSQNLVSERSVYFTLPQINGTRARASDSIYAPTSHGSNGQFLRSKYVQTGSTFAQTGFEWVDLPTANSLSKGVVKVGYTTSGKNYKVDIDDNGNLYCNVPWSSGTSYSAGSNISISSGKISVTTSSNNRIGYANNATNATWVYATSEVTSGAAVYCTTYAKSDGSMRLGPAGSSLRFKNSLSTDFDSSVLYKLQPTKFKYNNDRGMPLNYYYGFIAEDVAKYFEDAVLYNDEGLPSDLIYNNIFTLAVAEIQKLRKELDELKSKS